MTAVERRSLGFDLAVSRLAQMIGAWPGTLRPSLLLACLREMRSPLLWVRELSHRKIKAEVGSSAPRCLADQS